MKTINILIVLLHFIYANTSGVGKKTICLDGLSGVDNMSCWSEGCLQPCKSLMFTLLGAHGEDSTTIQIYEGTYSLSQNLSATDFYGINDLTIVGMNSHVFINCLDEVGGIAFFNCARINITNITISGCGALRNSTSKNFGASNFSFLDINVTMYFLFCKNITLTKVTIANSTGTGVVMYATVGLITIQLCAFLYNNAVASGGGLYIEFPYCNPGNNSCLNSTNAIPFEFAESSTYYIYATRFQGNAAYSPNENDAYILPQKYNHLAFGRGGGLSVFFKGLSRDNTVKVSYCNFSNNTAVWGGGILSEHQDYSTNNILIVDHCIFLENICPYSSIYNANGTGGGGVRLGYLFFDDTHCHNNTFLFRHTVFRYNGAYYGGGLSFYAPREDSIHATNALEFHNCSWFSNTGRLGSAIDLALWHPVVSGSVITPIFNNCTFYNNYYIQPLNRDQYVGIGALYSDNIPINFAGKTVFYNNSHSAVAVVTTYLSFDANSCTKFIGNSGRIGGAIALMGNAFIITSYNSNLSFVNNSADLKGGAIYGEFVGEHDLLSSRNCFIRYRNISYTSTQWKSNFYFQNNTVKTATLPNAIYATTILTCVWGGSYGNSTDNNLNEVFNWTNWKYDDLDTTNEINTAPLLLNATSNSSTILLIPGKRSTLPIEALDDNSRNVTSYLVMTIQSQNSSSVAISNYTQYVSDNSIIVYGDSSLNTTTTLVLQTTDPKVIYSELNVTLLPCPPGMVKSQDNPDAIQCVCGKSFGGRVKCAEFTSTILRGQWMGWVGSQFVVGDCAYCAGPDLMNISVVLPDSNVSLDVSLCGRVNRTGILCGHCVPQYGLTANLVCSDCTSPSLPIRVILYIVTQFLPVTIFFLILLLFNVSITSGPINSFVFFAQMISTACDITAEGSIPIPPKLNVAINTIYEVWNLNFLTHVLPNTCLGWYLFETQRFTGTPSTYKMVVAIRTATRKHPTVLGVVTRLASEPSFRDYKLLVWQSYSEAYNEEMRQTLESLGVTVFTQREVYPELSVENRIKITWGDPLNQVKWRTNHVLDFANLLEQSLQYQTDFILMLEDDMFPAKDSLDKVYLSLRYDVPIRADLLGYVTFFSMNQFAFPRGLIDITKMKGAEGACALGFHRSFAPRLIQRLRTYPYNNPVDIALWSLIDEDKQLHVFERVPNLFQHIPKESTLIRPDSKLKNSEDRSIRFVYDENNNSLLLHPSYDDGYIGCFNDMEIFSDLNGGCYKDNIVNRDLQKFIGVSYKPMSCMKACLEYTYFGLQFGKECYCGNSYGIYGPARETQCSTPCATDSKLTCGGVLQNSVFKHLRNDGSTVQNGDA
ncbi:hypothetical protein EMCRGX_G014930 [Ephydatia muelleri]